MRTATLALLFVLLPFAQPSAQLHAQSTEAAIKARLMGQPLYLRGFWKGDKLSYDSSGHLKNHSDAESFTLCGFEFTNVKLHANQLTLTGNRMGLEFQGPPRRVRIGKVRLTLDAPANGDYTQTLNTIFANGLAELVPTLPDAWRNYATKSFLPAISAQTAPAPESKDVAASQPKAIPFVINHGISAPILKYSKEPKFSHAAHDLLYSGTVWIDFWVAPDGATTHLSIATPAGLGLDENALEAVSQYKFIPARQSGKPVTVELKVKVDFSTF